MNEQVIQQITQLVAAAQQGNKEAVKALQDIETKAKQGDKQATAIMQVVQQIMQQQQGQTQAARHGAKLQYLRSLKNQCPEGEELYYYKKGGSVGCGCKKKEDGGQVQKDCGGAVAKFKAMRNGGDAPEKKKNQGPVTKDNPSNKNVKPTQKFKNDYSSKRVKDSEEDYNKGITNETEAVKIGTRVRTQPKGKAMAMGCGSKVVKKFKKHYKGGTLNFFK